MASNNHFTNSRSNLSTNSDAAEAVRNHQQQQPPGVTFARRTSSGRYVNYSRDDLDSELGSVDFTNYTVHIPPTPDNQPMDPSISQKVEEQYVSSSLFTGGFNSVTRAHLMDKVIESETSHPQMAGAKGSSCAIPGCDVKVMSDGRGQDLLPCECDFKICRDCFVDAVKAGGGMCPGCKEPYRNTDLTDLAEDGQQKQQRPMLPPPSGGSKMERRLSLMKSTKSGLMRSQTGDFDHNRWLFETSGTYGYGNAFWTKDGNLGGEKDGHGMGPQDLMSRPWRPLTRKLQIPAAVISPYRLLIFIRIVVLALFLMWRIKHKNQDAIWLWGMSVVCELWFAFSWLLDQLPKLCPINRATDLNVLKEKFETPTPSNPTGKSDLPGLDMFVSTADPDKEPPLVTSNTILSILAADYPVEKLACYVSDDGGALLTFEAMAEAASFANIWVPFCRKHDIEPRNPDSYFSLKRDPYKNKVKADFVKDRRKVKREYDEYKVRINGLPDSIRRRSDAYHAREEIKAMKQQRQNKEDEIVEPVKIPKATWMADGTHWPGTWLNSAPDHSRSDHAEHHPGCCSCCFPRKKKKSRVPEENRSLRMGGDSDDDEEMNLSLVPKKFGNSTFLIDSIPVAEFQGRPLADHPAVQNGRPPGALTIPRELLDASTVAEAIAVISCWYEDKTEWGTRIGWIYGSVTEDVVTGYRMHNRGWKSVYCVTKRDAFRGTAPINLTDRLHQVLRWATGSVEIFFSRNNAFLASPRMKILQRIAYLNVGIYPFTSIFLIVYCFLPALSLFSGQFIVQTLNVTFLIYLLIISITLCLLALLEIKWSGISLEEWWRNEQFWLIGGTSAHLAAVIQGLLKVVAGIEISFTLTSKSGGDDVDDEFADLYIVKWTSLMLPPITIMMVNLIAIAVGFSRTIYSVIPQWSKLIGGVFFSFWVLAHLYPFAKGLMGRRGRTPTIVYVWSGLIAITISLLWVAVNPPAGLLKVVAGIEISFTLTSKSGGDDVDDEFADLYIVKWTSLMLPPITIMMVNLIAIAVGFSRTIYSVIPQWSKLIGGVFFSFWVLAHLYPFAKGLMGRRGRTPTIVYVWSGLIAITISLLWVAVNPPAGSTQIGGSFTFP
ncbi:hypothetical protein DY000_02051605 [Brassica cretica]|uniref:Cellulose synthase-like protein D3 n=1 Tax=Brassica cretica TaxID=69181 RepID=A0ABQ7F855_BRACR|nr:hypothetical protein DY000_02051605 [Brassica cretica]